MNKMFLGVWWDVGLWSDSCWIALRSTKMIAYQSSIIS